MAIEYKLPVANGITSEQAHNEAINSVVTALYNHALDVAAGGDARTYDTVGEGLASGLKIFRVVSTQTNGLWDYYENNNGQAVLIGTLPSLAGIQPYLAQAVSESTRLAFGYQLDAKASEQLAAGHEVSARDDKQLAEAAAIAAQAARDAIFLNPASSGIFQTIAEGIAGTAIGEVFIVADDLGWTIYEHNASNQADRISGTYPSELTVLEEIKALDNRLSTNGLGVYVGSGDVWPIVTDQNFKAVLAYDAIGQTLVGAGLATNETVERVAKSVLAAAGQGNYVGDGPIYPIFTDQQYRILLGYDVENNVLTGAGGGGIVGTPSADEDLPANVRAVPAAINHFVTYGQSLSVGATAKPVLSVAQPYNNLTFQGGPRAYDGSAYSFSPLKPLVEDENVAPDGGSNRGETSCSGMSNYAITLAAIENGLNPSDHIILSSAPGHGGYSVTQLNKGTTWYENVFLEHVRQAYAINNDYAFHAYGWIQGENDNGAQMPYQTYYDHMIQLREDAETDTKAINGQSGVVFCITYQLTYGVQNWEDIALAHLDLCRNSDYFWMSTPMYHLPYAGDRVHLTNVGSKWLGAYIGRAYKRLVLDNKKPKFIDPKSATKRDNVVTVTFDVPTLPLRLDTDTLANTNDFGFRVVDGNGTVPISSVSVVENNKVQITLASSTSGPVEVRYALDYLGAGLTVNGGASGNLRDDTPDTITIAGASKPLYHVCPHFKMNVVTLGE